MTETTTEITTEATAGAAIEATAGAATETTTGATAAQWARVCRVDDIPVLGGRVVMRDAGNLAVFRTASNGVFALLDSCPHKGGPLSQGIVHGETVTCPLHSWQIDLTTGEARAPDQGCARRFPVRVDDSGDVFLDLA